MSFSDIKRASVVHWRIELLLAALALLALCVIADVWGQLNKPPGTIIETRGIGPADAPYRGALNIFVRKVDRRTRMATLDVFADIYGTTKWENESNNICKLILSLSASTSSRPTFRAQSHTPSCVRGSSPVIWGNSEHFTSESLDRFAAFPRAHVHHYFANVRLDITSNPPLFYPFDSVATAIAPSACINRDECFGGGKLFEDVRFHYVRVMLDDTIWREDKFELYETDDTNGTLTLKLRRQWFLKVVTLFVTVVLIVFLTNLFRMRDAQHLLPETLGLVATIWGFRQLVVPDGIHVFPTLIDYFALLAFGGMFLLLVARIRDERKKT